MKTEDRLRALSRSRRVAIDRRVIERPGELIDRSRRYSFTFDKVSYPAFHGDTIASALAASGVRVFSRSFKYHRPRGLMSATFHDPGCIVQADDEPNVRAAHRRVEPGMVVRSQSSWPSLRVDVGAVNQVVAPFLGAGFYYKTFIKPQRLWPYYERVLQRFAAGGKVTADAAHDRFDKRYAHVEVLVAGGGPAGMAAALGAAEAGAKVMLVEEEYELGGHLRYGDASDLALLRELRTAVQAEAAIEVLTNSVVTGRYDDNWVAVCQRGLPDVVERLVKVRASSLVLAPGLIERPYVFEGNDLPGVMLATGVRRLVNLYAVRPGERAVVFSANFDGDAAAADLSSAGAEVVKVVDARRGGRVVRATGSGGIERVELGDGSSVECDLLVTAVGWTSPTSLANMAGDRPVYSPEAARFVPGADLPPEVMLTGGILGDASPAGLVEHGRAVGSAATSRLATKARGSKAIREAALPVLEPGEHPELYRASTHGFVDFSEDVSSKDLFSAAKEGYDSVELVKRYTTATMGPGQGKLETANTVAVLAEATGRSIAETGTTVWRPPFVPITLGALAGQILEPVRYSSMQAWHEAHGAKPIVAGAWIRPEHYGDPAAEVRNVRENVGLIDVTPLGKILLHGPDVAHLLNFVYVNKWSKLEIGSVRYGVMCNEDGVVMDDGVTGRLGPEEYFMSTTSSGAGAVYEWLENWLQTSHRDWKIHLTPVTAAYASINVAGPRSRELLSRVVVDVDLSGEAFKYMQVRTGTIAGVPGCHMWRIGFTGELSYEIHVPSGYGQFVWDRLMDAGADLRVGAFGLEAQRIMRLEKGHFIVGQDTDAVTQAHAAGLDWLVKLDKDDFAGKPELTWEASRTDGTRLVAVQPIDPELVPPEASQIVSGHKTIEGRITSSRFSPTLGRSICLAMVSERLTGAGTIVTILLPDRTRVPARVMEHHAQYDPEGTRLRA